MQVLLRIPYKAKPEKKNQTNKQCCLTTSCCKKAFVNNVEFDIDKNYMYIFGLILLWQSVLVYRKIPKNKPRGLYFSKALFEGLIFGGANIWRGLSTEGNLRFKIDWTILIVGSKFTIFALFYFVFQGNFPSTSPRGAYIWRGDLTEDFLCYQFGGLIFGGAYTWRGLFLEFYGSLSFRVDEAWATFRLGYALPFHTKVPGVNGVYHTSPTILSLPLSKYI